MACVLLPHFAWQVESLRTEGAANAGNGAEAPGAIVVDGGAPPAVLDCSPGLRGVVAGMPLTEALSRNRGVRLIEPDVPRYRLAFERVLGALEARVPEVEDAGLGVAYVGIWGLEGLYGDDARVVHVLGSAASRALALRPFDRLRATQAQDGDGQARDGDGCGTGSGRGFEVRLGVGENKWLAYVAASTSRPGSARKVMGEPGRFMSRFPVDLLPVDYVTLERLRSFGLHRMEDVAALPRGAMQAQFGKAGALVWDLANGFDDRPLVPRRVEEAVSEYLTFPDATVSMAAVLPAIESLLSRAYGRPRLARRYAREALLEARVLGRPPWTLRVAFKEPAGSPTRALFGIKAKLEGVDFPGPLEDMRLTLTGLTGEAGRQESLWSEVLREQQLHEALAQLRVRLGVAPPIYRVRELEPWSRIPERRHALVQLGP